MHIDKQDVAVRQDERRTDKAKVVAFLNPECQLAYLEGRVGNRACDIIDLVLETQMATQSLVANSQIVHDNLITIQRLARDLLTPVGSPDGGEVSHGSA